jgi:hypothetical protein
MAAPCRRHPIPTATIACGAPRVFTASGRLRYLPAGIRAATHPLLPLNVLADPNRGAAFFTLLIASAGLFGVFLFLTYYLQGTLGCSPVRNGLASCPWWAR